MFTEAYKDIEAALSDKNGAELQVIDSNNRKTPIPNNEKPLLEDPSGALYLTDIDFSMYIVRITMNNQEYL